MLSAIMGDRRSRLLCIHLLSVIRTRVSILAHGDARPQRPGYRCDEFPVRTGAGILEPHLAIECPLDNLHHDSMSKPRFLRRLRDWPTTLGPADYEGCVTDAARDSPFHPDDALGIGEGAVF